MADHAIKFRYLSQEDFTKAEAADAGQMLPMQEQMVFEHEDLAQHVVR